MKIIRETNNYYAPPHKKNPVILFELVHSKLKHNNITPYKPHVFISIAGQYICMYVAPIKNNHLQGY